MFVIYLTLVLLLSITADGCSTQPRIIYVEADVTEFCHTLPPIRLGNHRARLNVTYQHKWRAGKASEVMGRLCPPRCPGYDAILGSMIDCSAGLNSGNIMNNETKISLKRMDELLKGVEARIFSFCKRDDYVSFYLNKDGKYFKMSEEEQKFVNDVTENYRFELKCKFIIKTKYL
ncbi:unnamed protein product [Hymenolepis diminuta]|uniref:Uncharacterized protein n=1 Tax=Hymenolepis diminuta TaxID=6216 RepID=A0A564YH83_HYMDI|nr:unnamed protein product [Hymenolepis diminuta]